MISRIESHGMLPTNCTVDTFNYIEKGYIDSMALLKFIIDIEMHFDISFSDEDIMSEGIRTIGGMVDFIENSVKNHN